MSKKFNTPGLILTLFIFLIQACGGGGGDGGAPNNSAPTADTITITDSNGGQALVGDSMIGSFSYNDAENDAQANSSFRWLRNGIAIDGATTFSYTLVADDIDQNITFEVTPVALTGTLTGDAVTSAAITIPIPPNLPPVASSVTIVDLNGGDPLVGEALEGQYTYNDIDGDANVGTIFRWLRNGVVIPNTNSTNYILVADDAGMSIRFQVTPASTTGTSPGITVESQALNIPMAVNNPPTASNILITDVNAGAIELSDTLIGSYTYTDAESDLEGTTSFRWLRNGVAISAATTTSYTLVSADSGQPITFEVTPIASSGTITGSVVASAAITYNELTDNWAQISAGNSHTLAIKQDGSLWSWGSNLFRQLGDGTDIFKTSPVRIGVDTNWMEVSAGDNHSLAVKSNGTLWAWGTSTYGALGADTISRQSSPTQIGIDENWSSVYTGRDYSLAIKTDGTLWAWGRNDTGQLGINTDSDQTTPLQVGTDTTWVQIDAGLSHTLGLKSGGTVWSWGKNDKGQLGNSVSGINNKQISPIQIGTESDWAQVSAGNGIGFAHSMALKTDGTLWVWGAGGLSLLGNGDNRDDQLIPIQLGSESNWIAINAGRYVSFAIKSLGTSQSSGTLWAWGWNIFNLTGIAGLSSSAIQQIPAQVDNSTNWQFASSTNAHAVALKTTGTISSWGDNYTGELGIGVSGREQNRSTPTAITPLSNVVQMATGQSHSAAIKSDGTLWTWGLGLFNSLGNDSTADQTIPIKVGSATDWSVVDAGYYHNLALKTDGTLYTWGYNASGLGDANIATSPIPAQIGTDDRWSEISAGYNFSLAVKTDGTLWAWGSNGSGQLGTGNTTRSNSPIQIGMDTDWIQVAAGSSHSLALKDNGTLWAWGRNSSGQLGNETNTNSTSPVQVGTATSWTQIAVGGNHSLALRTVGNDTSLWTWGSNRNGQIGNGLSGFANNLTSPVQIGTDTSWIQISAG